MTPGEVHAPPPCPTLPFELIEDILSRLPVKTLLRLRCVCKSWKSLISDPRFVERHLRMSNADPNFTHHRIILCSFTPNFAIRTCSVHSLFNNIPTSAIELKYPLKLPDWYPQLVGSCDGLLCFATGEDRILLWNPSTRIFKESPCLKQKNTKPGSFTVFGFGYDHLNDAYKVVAIFCYGGGSARRYRTNVHVWTLGNNYWRRIQAFPRGFLPTGDSGKFVNGTLNWVANSLTASTWDIVSLDLANESYGQILQPDYENVQIQQSLGVLRDCICILCDYCTHSDVWIMKEYGVKESWTKLLTISYSANLGTYPSSMPLCISDHGEVLLELLSYPLNIPHFLELAIYNPGDSTFQQPVIQNLNRWLPAQVYVESLISPTKGF